jgi:peptidoglycan/xylan/chitin deacetylase (PgdA/CDA1 family)
MGPRLTRAWLPAVLAAALAAPAAAEPPAGASAAPGAPQTAPSEPVGPIPGVVTHLATREKLVALTFDACQAFERMTLDRGITEVLVARQVPFTIFVGGRFARDNAAALRELAGHPFVDLENHSWSHPRDMRLLDDERIRLELARAAAMIREVSGRRTTLFRFPGGNADERTVELARALGYQVVHWSWAEGDPDPQISADRLVTQTLARTRAGDILIFHVNGRGWHTAEALPRILDGLAARGFRIVPLPEFLPAR